MSEVQGFSAARGGKKGRAEQGATPGAVNKSTGRSAAAKLPKDQGAHAIEVVPSVAELAAAICHNPEHRKKRLKQAEALRECGFDECKVAELLFALAGKLSRNKEKAAGGLAAAKLLLEVVKEARNLLEPQKNAGGGDATEPPEFVRLIHNVPRPVRPQ
jgi:hypothetical protein